ncbi:MAG: ABC transporter ATP-binding protein [Acidobacteriia bacterium]|nr:ABC transporter ATP-binding protein [Terriglobia bacterium]
MPDVAAVSIRGITKQYGKLRAVNNLNLEVAPGEILGFLGLNGAGKTTTIRILLDLLRPTAGKAFVFGHDCQSEGLQARSDIGYLPGEMGIYSDLTGREVLDLLAGLNRQPVDSKRRCDLQDRLGLPDSDLRRTLREYSTGMKRKLGLIQAFQADARLLILDEPTEGLDPLMQEAFCALLAETKRRGATVFMSSHVLSEVDRVCDRIALLRKGELVLLRTVEEIRGVASRRVRVYLAADVPPPELPPGVQMVETLPHTWTLQVEGFLGPLLETLRGLPVKDIEVVEARLEDVVMRYYRGDNQ